MSVRLRRGASAVEFALALSVLIFLMMATVEYAWLLFQRTQAVHAVREGCRYGATVAYGASPSPDSLAAARTKASLVEYSFDADDVTITTTYADLTLDAAGTMDTLRVEAVLVYRPLMGGLVPTPGGFSVSMSSMLQDAT